MKIILETEQEKQVLEKVAEGWEAIPSCYLDGFECWASEHWEEILKYYGSHELSLEGF